MPPAPLLSLREVSQRYGEREVLREVSLDVGSGACVALVGPNGCGKSTLLRLAAGREAPVSGRVLFAGEPLDHDDPATRARIASVMDPASWYPDLTVREHLRFVAHAHGMGRRAGAEVDRVLAAHRLAGRADAVPGALSSGQTQLLLLAAAFLRPYELLLLDEPEQRLDSTARGELAERIVSAKREGAAVLLATHSSGLARRVADRVVSVEDGRAVPARMAAEERRAH